MTVSPLLARLSPPDWAFTALAALAGAGLVALALNARPAGVSPVTTDTSFLVEGAALSELIPGPGTSIRFVPDAPGGPIARVSADSTFDAAGSMSAGVAAIPPPEFEDRVAGRRIRVSMDLRATGSSGPETVRIGYFTIGYGDSGWREVEIGPDVSTVSFEWDAPRDAQANQDEAVGIWPDPEGLGREVVLSRIRVDILPGDDA